MLRVLSKVVSFSVCVAILVIEVNVRSVSVVQVFTRIILWVGRENPQIISRIFFKIRVRTSLVIGLVFEFECMFKFISICVKVTSFNFEKCIIRKKSKNCIKLILISYWNSIGHVYLKSNIKGDESKTDNTIFIYRIVYTYMNPTTNQLRSAVLYVHDRRNARIRSSICNLRVISNGRISSHFGSSKGSGRSEFLFCVFCHCETT